VRSAAPLLSAGPAIIDPVGYLLANRCQLEKLLLDEGVLCRFGKLSIFGRLFPEIVRAVHAVSRLFLTSSDLLLYSNISAARAAVAVR
jgi:hypothetical protein